MISRTRTKAGRTAQTAFHPEPFTALIVSLELVPFNIVVMVLLAQRLFLFQEEIVCCLKLCELNGKRTLMTRSIAELVTDESS